MSKPEMVFYVSNDPYEVRATVDGKELPGLVAATVTYEAGEPPAVTMRVVGAKIVMAKEETA
jgi:hypothetical protein